MVFLMRQDIKASQILHAEKILLLLGHHSLLEKEDEWTFPVRIRTHSNSLLSLEYGT